MNKIILLILMTAGLITANHYYKELPVNETLINQGNALVNGENKQNIGVPQKIIIEKIGVETEIEEVGLDELKRMDVPRNPDNVGWYRYGPKPGEKGSAVIDGHLDTKNGPAIFYKLSQVQINDTIEVIDINQQTYKFRVVEIKTFSNDNFPIDEVFLKNDSKRLNLITCSGIYDRAKQLYDKRLVIFATALEEVN